MANLIYPGNAAADRQRFSRPVGSSSRSDAAAVALEVVTNITPDAADGNTVQDHLVDIKARMGHFTDSEIYKGKYNNSTTYAEGDEVDWQDSSNQKHFYKRKSAGDDGGSGTPVSSDNAGNWEEIGVDLHNIVVTDEAIASENAAGLYRESGGRIVWNRRIAKMLIAAQTEQDVIDAIDLHMNRLVNNALWRGTWAAGVYPVGVYAQDTADENFYRCIVARSASNTSSPRADSTGWVQVAGTELLALQRLRDVESLLDERIRISTAAAGNRGKWVSRRTSDETFVYDDPPMQWKGPWSSTGVYYYGSVTVDNSRMYLLNATSTIITGKTGSTRPANDSDWTDISYGHAEDTPRFRGDWANGTFLRGDIAVHRGNYYISKTNHSSVTHAPDQDNTNWDLLDNFAGTYSTEQYYPEGVVVIYDTHLWWSLEQVNPSDPDPGESNDTKWKQIDGASQEDLERLRLDLEAQINSATTRKGLAVDVLPNPPTTSSPAEVYLRAKANRSYTAPAALIDGGSERTASIGDEVGVYKRTTGTANLIHGVVGKTTHEGRNHYGIFSRSEHSNFAVTTGKFTHNPMGSCALIIGARETAEGSGEYVSYLMLKSGLINLIGGGTDPANLYVLPRNYQGNAGDEIHYAHKGDVAVLGQVSYTLYYSNQINARTALGDFYENHNSEATRAATFEIRTSAGGSARYLGNRTIAWLYEPPENNTDNLVFSQDIHTINVYTQAEYDALTELVPRSLVLVYQPSGG